MRKLLGILCVPFLKLTNKRFSKKFRKAEGGWRKFMYKYVDIVGANIIAGGGRND